MFGWVRSSSLLRLLGVLVAILLLTSLAPLSAADNHYLTEYVQYNLGYPLPLVGSCDEEGIGSVRFCQELSRGHWDKFALFVRDRLGQPVGGFYEFRGSAGEPIEDGFFCKDIQGAVPGGASELYVEPGVPSEGCPAGVGTTGNVIVTWRVSRQPGEPVPPPEPCPPEEEEEEDCLVCL